MATQMNPATIKKQQDAAKRLMQLLQLLTEKPLIKKRLTSDDVVFILHAMMKKLKAAKCALIEIASPVHVVGDTHGQYRDVVRTFDILGWPNGPTEEESKDKEFVKAKRNQNYLFLGDYVDRGNHSIEVVCLLFGLSLAYPKRVHLLRGNHESREINKTYGFYDEVMEAFKNEKNLAEKDREKIWNQFNDVFEWLPLVATINQDIICMHGGIPTVKIDKELNGLWEHKMPIKSIKDDKYAADLLWSDPTEEIEGVRKNPRGLGHQFGYKALTDFLNDHGLHFCVRAHQVFAEGWKAMHQGQCITIFGAPNYGGSFNNDAAVISVNENSEMAITVIAPYR